MKKSTRVLILVLTLGGMVTAASIATAADGETQASNGTATGRDLYVQRCSTCHGLDGTGDIGPSLHGVGAASADFQLRTGRMPLAEVGARPGRKPTPFTADQISALTAYVASLGPGPAVPVVDINTADLPRGGELFRTNCASCHGSAARGGALSNGLSAPNLYDATPVEVVEAMRTGPSQMPIFDEDHISPADADSIARYVIFLQTEPDPGGFGLGRIGPVPEGIVAWAFGLGVVILAAVFIERGSR
ncbi:MAG: c-type cytochrome [Acidimicrobiia bacterium]|jgi:ubiquinol-cytochrome c reductase cytochrome c subunit